MRTFFFLLIKKFTAPVFINERTLLLYNLAWLILNFDSSFFYILTILARNEAELVGKIVADISKRLEVLSASANLDNFVGLNS